MDVRLCIAFQKPRLHPLRSNFPFLDNFFVGNYSRRHCQQIILCQMAHDVYSSRVRNVVMREARLWAIRRFKHFRILCFTQKSEAKYVSFVGTYRYQKIFRTCWNDTFWVCFFRSGRHKKAKERKKFETFSSRPRSLLFTLVCQMKYFDDLCAKITLLDR